MRATLHRQGKAQPNEMVGRARLPFLSGAGWHRPGATRSGQVGAEAGAGPEDQMMKMWICRICYQEVASEARPGPVTDGVHACKFRPVEPLEWQRAPILYYHGRLPKREKPDLRCPRCDKRIRAFRDFVGVIKRPDLLDRMWGDLKVEIGKAHV